LVKTISSNSATQPVQSIVIAGGGTAGWLSACCLAKVFLGTGIPERRVTVIESSSIPTVGVGEATLPSLVRMLEFLGVSEREFLLRCDSTFKLGIKFSGWNRFDSCDSFWHPFGHEPSLPNDPLSIAQYWLHLYRSEAWRIGYARSCFAGVECAVQNRAPKALTDDEFKGRVPYAYHLDAGLFAELLHDHATGQGVNRVIDNIAGVELDSEGYINCLKTEHSGDLHADLFIDCTGFSGLLINKALGVPFQTYSEWLACDRAVAMPISRKEDGDLSPFTTATAMECGWIWETPLTSRRGSGYVYSSSHIRDNEVEDQFRKFHGVVDSPESVRFLKMRVGKTRDSWYKNCVSVGLSSGFVEPLESTGIYLIEVALEHLISHFPSRRCESRLSSEFNKKMTDHYEEIRDFLVMHYYLSNRRDSDFWQDVTKQGKVPDSLSTRLEHWSYVWPNNTPQGSNGPLFPDYSYVCMLAGMRNYPLVPHALISRINESSKYFKNLQVSHKKVVEKLPSHSEYFSRFKHVAPN